nr:hypothetical protein GCM10020093_106260 [Planobispora longispora]
MERQKVAFGRSTPAGSFLGVPDRLEAAQGLLDGTLAARAVLDAADGDPKALARLEKYASRTGDPEFVKVFLDLLGTGGVTRLPGSLAAQLSDARKHGDSDRIARLSSSGTKALGMLSAALARGTDPKNPAYMGDGFLRGLVEQGRAEHRTGDVKYSGYQAQALLWRAHDGKPPFSKKFMEIVGRDAIVYEHEQRKDEWAASKDLLGRTFAGDQIPVFDLAGALGLGGLLRPGSEATSPGRQTRSSVVDDLLHAASSSREASQALLDHVPAGWKESVLDYMLTTRWDAFRYLDDYRPFNNVLIAATTGQDATSAKLAAEMTKILADEVRPAFGKADSGNLAIKDRDALDRLAPLRYPLARAMAANIDQFSRLLLNHSTFGKASAEDLSYALALATGDDAGFEALVRAQTEHMRAAFDAVPRSASPWRMSKSSVSRRPTSRSSTSTRTVGSTGPISSSS